ncbi:MAG: sulfatase family protein [Planctomycetota bacterium]|jgi:arylsulfatase A
MRKGELRHTRRDFLKAMGLCTASLVTSGCMETPEPRAGEDRHPPGRPNVVIFLADDLGYGDLACYGHPFIKTPSLDKLAAEGMKLTDCYAAAPICSPSRAALLTGRFSYRAGVYHLAGKTAHLRNQEKTIAELLKEAGYATCFLGKWHLGKLDGTHPTPSDQGFDHWFATEVNSFDGPLNPKNFLCNGKDVGETKGWYCDVVVQEATDWLKKRKPDRPFFIEICTHEPHTPLAPAPEYMKQYDTPQVRALEKKLGYGDVPRYPLDNLPEEKRYYYGTVTQLDAAFGRLMNELDDMDLRDNTLVIFTSDNGPEYPGGSTRVDPLRRRAAGTPGELRGMKRHLYEGGIRVPGIIRWPRGIEPGSVSSEPISSVDFLPTLCEMSGAKLPTDRALDGVDISPAFSGESLKRTRPLCWNINFTGVPNMAMRTGDEVLLGFAQPPEPDQKLMDWIKSAELDRFELYNLKTDISQKIDLARHRTKHLHSLINRMKELWRQLQHEGPTWPAYGRTKPAVGRFGDN